MRLNQILIYEDLNNGFQRIISSEEVLKDEIEEIKVKFKDIDCESYSYFKLKSLRYAFVKTSCIGDINIIHCIIIHEEINFYPYEAVGSGSFIDKTGTDILDILESINLNGNINENTIMQFIKSKDPKIIRDIINAVIDFKQSGRSICIVDHMKNFPCFLGSIQRVFPIKLSKNITFTTCENLKNDREFMIHFSENSSSYDSCYTFDLLREIKAVVEREYKYSELVELGYYTSWQTLKNYQRFFQGFSYENIDSEVDSSYILFILLNIKAASMQSRDINGALEFLLKYCDESSLEGIFERNYKIFADMVSRLDKRGSILLSDVVFKAASISNSKPSYEEAVKIFFLILDHLLIDIKDNNVNVFFDRYFDRVRQNNIFLKYPLSGDRIKYILKILSQNNMENRILFYSLVIIKSACELGYSWNQVTGIDEMEFLLDMASKQALESKNSINEVIDSAIKSRDILVHIIFLLYNRASNDFQLNFIIERFIDFLDNQDEEISIDIRREIYRLSGGKILIGEFKRRLEISSSKTEFFKEYLNKVFQSVPDYYNKYFSEAVKSYMSSLDLEDAYKESLFFIDSLENGSIAIDADSVSGIINAFERGIDLDDINSITDIVSKAKRIKRRLGIETSPDMVSLVNFIYELDSSEDINVQDALEDLSINLNRLKGDKLRVYLLLCIPRIIEYIKSKDDHKIIVEYLFRGEDEGEFIKNYIDLIENLLNRNSEIGYGVFMHFVVYYYFYLEGNYRLLGENEIIEKIEERILSIMEKMDKSFLFELDGDVRKEFEENGYSIPVKWGQMLSKSMENRSFKNKLKNIFKK